MLEASRRTAVPRLLAMASVLAVFVPSFFMSGVAQQMFVPMSLAVELRAMVASYVLSSTLVPVLAVWLIDRSHEEAAGGVPRADSQRLRLGCWSGR